MEGELSFTAEELTERAGVPLRTLRYYISEGLISGPGTRGKGARYTAEHLWRLRAIRRLASDHVPLHVIVHDRQLSVQGARSAISKDARQSYNMLPCDSFRRAHASHRQASAWRSQSSICCGLGRAITPSRLKAESTRHTVSIVNPR